MSSSFRRSRMASGDRSDQWIFHSSTIVFSYGNPSDGPPARVRRGRRRRAPLRARRARLRDQPAGALRADPGARGTARAAPLRALAPRRPRDARGCGGDRALARAPARPRRARADGARVRRAARGPAPLRRDPDGGALPAAALAPARARRLAAPAALPARGPHGAPRRRARRGPPRSAAARPAAAAAGPRDPRDLRRALRPRAAARPPARALEGPRARDGPGAGARAPARRRPLPARPGAGRVPAGRSTRGGGRAGREPLDAGADGGGRPRRDAAPELGARDRGARARRGGAPLPGAGAGPDGRAGLAAELAARSRVPGARRLPARAGSGPMSSARLGRASQELGPLRGGFAALRSAPARQPKREDDPAAGGALARDAHRRAREPARRVLDEALGREARDLGELLRVTHLDAAERLAVDREAPAAHVEDRAREARDEVPLARGPSLPPRPLLRADLGAALELEVEAGGEEPLGRARAAPHHVLGPPAALDREQQLGQPLIGREGVPEAGEHLLAEDAEVLGVEARLELGLGDAPGRDEAPNVLDHGLERAALDGRNAHGRPPGPAHRPDAAPP